MNAGVLAATLFGILMRVASAAGASPLRLTVTDAEALALTNNPHIAVARLNALASEQATREVQSSLYPTLSANLTAVAADQGGRITAGGLNNPVVYDRAAGGLVASQLVTDFGRRSNLISSSKLRTEAEGERAQATVAEIVLAVDRAFYNALETRALRTVAEQTVTARKDLADRVGALAKSKLRSDLDLSFAEVNLSEANLLALDAENNQKAALAALAAVLGYSNPPEFELVDDTAAPDSPPADIDALTAEALARRPEISALELDARAAEKFHIAERDLWLPNVRALGVVGAAPYRNDVLSSWYGAVGVNVEIPIFNGFLFSARAKEADLEARAARQRLLDLKNSVLRDVRTSWLDASAAFSRLAVAKQLLDHANVALGLARSRYDLGLSSIVELSEAQLQQTRAQIGDAEARYIYRVALAVLQFEVAGS